MSDPISTRTALLRAEHLGREIDGKRILHDINFELAEADVLAIVGPSGSGKSSLLRLLNRLDEPTTGTVYLAGIDYRLLAPAELRRRVGMVMQTAFLFPGTVADNVRYGPLQRGEVLSAEAVSHLLVDVGLDGFGMRQVQNLSGGEAQRVSLARALANSPSVLLLDEPTSALDESAKLGIENLITEIVAARHLTCAIVTHDLEQADRMAQNVAVLRAGTIVRIGSAKEVLRAERTV